MGIITIKVQVGAVFPALEIKVTIDNLDDNTGKTYTYNQSFEHNYTVAKGKYMITVSGMNQDGDSTDIWVSGDFIDNKHVKADKVFFSKVFSGTVNS